MRVVAHFRTRLTAVERFDGRIAVQNPRRAERLLHALGQTCVHPGCTAGQLGGTLGTFILRAAPERVGRQGAQRPPQALVAEYPVHIEDLRGDGIAAQTRDVGITPLTVKNGQQPGTQHIGDRRCVGAGIGQRTLLDPALEQSGDFKKLGKKHQLPQRRGAAALVPAHLKPTPRRIQPLLTPGTSRLGKALDHRLAQRLSLKCPFTHRVSLLFCLKPMPVMSLTAFDND